MARITKKYFEEQDYSDYLKSFSNYFDENISYFNPVCLLEEFKYEFKEFTLNTNNDLNDFLNLLNKIQFNIIYIQQLNLIADFKNFLCKDGKYLKKTNLITRIDRFLLNAQLYDKSTDCRFRYGRRCLFTYNQKSINFK